MKHRTFLSLALALTGSLSTIGWASQTDLLTSNYSGKQCTLLKQNIRAGQPNTMSEIAQLPKRADMLMGEPPVNLVQGKKHVAPSGDPHDYVSLATYFWPNPDTSDGLPYVAKDGIPNPAKHEYDERLLMEMVSRVDVLSRAYFYLGKEPYAEAAIRQVYAWFLDPETRMNPNLNHAQMRLGRDQGSSSGIIDARGLTLVTDGMQFLAGSKALTPETETGVKEWFREYLDWLLKSKNGIREAQTTNNHGVWYDAQVAAIAAYIGDQKAAQATLESVKKNRIATQIEPDGSMPRELDRTLSATYCCFNLNAFLRLAFLGETCGVDLWNYATPDGRSIRKAVDYMLPFATGEKTWGKKQLKPSSFNELLPILRNGERIWNEPAYTKAAEIVGSRKTKEPKSNP